MKGAYNGPDDDLGLEFEQISTARCSTLHGDQMDVTA